MLKTRSARAIRRQVQQLLEQHGVQRPPVPVEVIAELVGAKLKYSPYEGELAGMLIRDHGRCIIGINSNHHTNRQRFTIAHEIGHLILHDIQVHIDRDFRVLRRDANSSLAIDHLEIEANRFAAELLMPFDMLVKDLAERNIDVEDEETLRPLARRYRVSRQAITHRIANIVDFYADKPSNREGHAAEVFFRY
jgi:Zn-dependent peptidase ImmA (M78 family)